MSLLKTKCKVNPYCGSGLLADKHFLADPDDFLADPDDFLADPDDFLADPDDFLAGSGRIFNGPKSNNIIISKHAQSACYERFDH